MTGAETRARILQPLEIQGLLHGTAGPGQIEVGSDAMQLDVAVADLESIAALRELYRGEMNCQIVHDSWHARGWYAQYGLRLDGWLAGYGAVGGIRGEVKDSIMEFFVLPEYRGQAPALFRRLIDVSGAKRIEAQTNDVLLTLMLLDCATTIERNEVLFRDGFTTNLAIPGAVFRRRTDADAGRVFDHRAEPQGEWVIESGGAIVGTGGILFHYNPPYGDIYMEVAEPHRRRGFGSYLIQELKRACYEMGKVPAARCNRDNAASRATLQKAGMVPCGRLLVGEL